MRQEQFPVVGKVAEKSLKGDAKSHQARYVVRMDRENL
jgi:hypothetical protein